MTSSVRRRRSAFAVCSALLLTSVAPVMALEVRPPSSRFDALTVDDKARASDVATAHLESLAATDAKRAGWEQFRSAHGQDWSIHLDRRSGAPLLAEGTGIPWTAVQAPSVDAYAASVRAFIAANTSLLLADDAELVLNRDASAELSDNVWQIVFDRAVSGVPVAGERYVFTIGHGNLIAFGSPRWSRIDVKPVPAIDAGDAQRRLFTFMGLTAADAATVVEKPALEVIPLRAGGVADAAKGPYKGAMGAGYASALVWRIAVRVAGEPGTWTASVDAETGAIRSFADANRYARAKGGVYPISDDQICPDGCEQAGTAIPFATVTVNGANQTTNTLGTFNCTPIGATATTTLGGQYVKVVDTCGPISQSVSCNTDLDLQSSAGIDCDVPAGASLGNTHSARSSFYHLNRIAEHARTWLPSRSWLNALLTDNVNLNLTCNAYWDGGSVNFFKSGGGCNNTGEIAGVFLHEWGHGLDQNDGGGFDNPTEAYADITAFMSTHVSCIGRGFLQSGNCGGNGNACLSCTGVRDMDWDKRANHTPSTPAGFVANYCSGGDGPCGGEQHCEAYVSGEALWDLAVRDLPATGLDPASSWQLADKLWYKSRLGSGDNAYNCALPDSDGCAATSWFTKLRIADDDDGSLANGTPHAAAIFAAFNRHAIACGTADSATNLSSSTCPTVAAPVLTATAGSASAALSWTPVANSIGYRIMRNDAGCQAATTRLSLLTGTSFTDASLVNGYPLYYSIQAIAANAACDGPLSNCQAVTPQPAAGSVKLDAASYGCSGVVNITVTDSNIGTQTTTATFVSTTETQAETITLTRIAPGSATYAGSIALTGNPPAHDGVLTVGNGDTITARYVDANDGLGHSNLQRVTTAAASCPVATPGVKPVADGSFGSAMTAARADAAGSTLSVTWDVSTCTSADHHILYGNLENVATATVLGAACDLGTTGSALWSGVPAADLWFVVVGDDNATTEGSWGSDGNVPQRGGNTASGFCGLTTRDNLGVCP